MRESVKRGDFEEMREVFEGRYQRELPVKTGQGPRVRGYTFKSMGRGEPKKNPVGWRELDGGGKLGGSGEMNDRKG